VYCGAQRAPPTAYSSDKAFNLLDIYGFSRAAPEREQVLPDSEPAAGPIAVALTAAGAVGLAGALIGALTKWGIPQGRIEEYEKGISLPTRLTRDGDGNRRTLEPDLTQPQRTKDRRVPNFIRK
jgi:hypothetical protein